jgi:xyloglucan fucosyltransferase
MYLLSMCDVLVTSGFSTFGYVAQGLGGLQPWIMSRPSPWEEWTEGRQAAPQPPCQRTLSVEPCFHSPSSYDCTARRDVELDKVTPYIRRCVDVSWGIKLVNQSRDSQW